MMNVLIVYKPDGSYNRILTGRKFRLGLETEFAAAYMTQSQRWFEMLPEPEYQLKMYLDTVSYTE